MATNRVIVSGFGGQGVMGIGQLLTYAGMFDDKHVSWLPSYGPAMRGGAANCSVIISDEPIGAPNISTADAAIVMNEPSLDKFESYVAPGGHIFINSSLVNKDTSRKDITSHHLPVNDLTAEYGNPRVLNMIRSAHLTPSSIWSANKLWKKPSTNSTAKKVKKSRK